MREDNSEWAGSERVEGGEGGVIGIGAGTGSEESGEWERGQERLWLALAGRAPCGQWLSSGL